MSLSDNLVAMEILSFVKLSVRFTNSEFLKPSGCHLTCPLDFVVSKSQLVIDALEITIKDGNKLNNRLSL